MAVQLSSASSIAARCTAISTTSLRILKPFSANDFRSSSGRFDAVGPHRLLHQVVEQLLDERRVHLGAVGQELRPARVAPANFAVSPARVS